MRMKFLWVVLLALPLPLATLVYGSGHGLCHALTTPFRVVANCSSLECCEQGAKADSPQQKVKPVVPPTDPDLQVMFRVEGLNCPAVKGIGCGQMLQGVLASLDKVDGVGTSSANYTGSMIRVTVTHEADRDEVVEAVRKVLTHGGRKVVRLTESELKRALDREQWRGSGRIGELSSIEFHTLALHRVKTFAKAEKLDKKIADKLVEIAEQQWQRLSDEARADGLTQPEDWGKRIRASLPAFLERAKGILSPEQLERFKQTLTGQCADEECPEAPPDPTLGGKTPRAAVEDASSRLAKRTA